MSDFESSFAKLNDEQRQAVLHDGDTVVLAGPGSGKTATLVLKVFHLLDQKIRPPRGLACITYNHEAAAEFRTRLQHLGVRPDRRMFLGTVHGFCLNCVIRPLAALAGRADLATARVVMDRATEAALQGCLNQEGVNERPSRFRKELTAIRRAMSLGDSTDGFGDDRIRVAVRFDALLAKYGAIDFEAMVLQALSLMRSSVTVRELLSARFPWLVVDEYQDLGGPLHAIVRELHVRGSSQVFAVGDPHQSIYGFNGADPKYLKALAADPAFRAISLRFNYRSGNRLIRASQAALSLDAPLDYSADPARADPGEVFIHEVPGDIAEQVARIITTIIPSLVEAAVPLHEIAILYRQKGRLLDSIVAQLSQAGIAYLAERDERLPRSPLCSWLRQCARWAADNAVVEPVNFAELVADYHRLCVEAGDVDHGETTLAFRRHLYTSLSANRDGGVRLSDWLSALDASLHLTRLTSEATTRAEDVDALSRLIKASAAGGHLANMTLVEFAKDARLQNRLVVTTYHSSKGRQFEAMILPAVQEGLMPQRSFDRLRGRFDEPLANSLEEDRRLFYVGLTRAKRFVHLLYSPQAHDDKGNALPAGPSRFVTEVRQRLV